MTWFSNIYKDETVSQLLEDTQKDIAKELSNFRKYCQSYKRKLNIVHDFVRQRNRASFDKMESEMKRICGLVRFELKLELNDKILENHSTKKVEKAIQEETSEPIISKLKELKQDLISLLTVIEKIKRILLGQLEFINENKIYGKNASENFQTFNELIGLEYKFLNHYGFTGKNEEDLLDKISNGLMETLHFKQRSANKFKLPVPHGSYRLLGTPLIPPLAHVVGHMKYAWDFIVKEGTKVFAAQQGKVVVVKVDSKVQDKKEIRNALEKNNTEMVAEAFLNNIPIFIKSKEFISLNREYFLSYLQARFTSLHDIIHYYNTMKRYLKEDLKSIIQKIKEGDRDTIMVAGNLINLYMYLKSNIIIIEHRGGEYYSAYLHLMYNGSYVHVGQRIKKGETIGLAGKSGTYLPHLHFEVFKKRKLISPYNAFFREKSKSIPISFER